MTIRPGDKVFDLYGEMGFGTVVDVYTNYHDDPRGEKLAICRFEAEEGSEETVCDRSLDQITTDLNATPVQGIPLGSN